MKAFESWTSSSTALASEANSMELRRRLDPTLTLTRSHLRSGAFVKQIDRSLKT